MRRFLSVILCLAIFTSESFGAWGSVGSFATDTNITGADPYVFATDAQLDAGNVGVCLIATDNDGNGTDTDDFGTVTDAALNTWNVIGENEVDNGSAGGGAALLIAYTKATSNLSGDITVDLSASRTAKVASCWEFTVSGGATISQAGTEQKEDVTSGSGLEVGALTIGSLSSAEHLWIRAWASERNSNDVTSYTGSWSNFTAQFTTGGGSAANMAVNGEFIIATATSQESNPTTPSGTDRASSMVALDESAGGGGGGGGATPRRRVLISQ